MVSCTSVTREEIRAEIWMENTLLASTPMVNNISVNKSRTQMSTTFSVTFEIQAGISFPMGADLVIKAGTRGNLQTIFTGLVESVTTNPSFGKPTYYLITMGGQGVLTKLKDKKFSRRLRSDGQGLYCLIKGGPLNSTSYHSTDKNIGSGNHTFVKSSPDLTRGGGENSPLIVTPSAAGNQGRGGVPAEVAGSPSGGSTADGFRPHTHEDMDEGGPAFGVYSAD